MTMESKIQAQFGTFLHVKQGLKKGDWMAPIFFILALEYVIRKLQQTENKHVCTNSHGIFLSFWWQRSEGQTKRTCQRSFYCLINGREGIWFENEREQNQSSNTIQKKKVTAEECWWWGLGWFINWNILTSVLQAKMRNYRKYGAEFKQLIELIFPTLPMIMRCDNIW
jgi:hypothetical protein